MYYSYLSLTYCFHCQNAQNGSSGGQNVDGAVYQQGAAVTYGQDGHEFSLLDGATFKVPTDARVAALPNPGTALMGAYTTGATSGAYDSIIHALVTL